MLVWHTVLKHCEDKLQAAPVFAGVGSGSGSMVTHLPSKHCRPLQSLLATHSGSSAHGTSEHESVVAPFVRQHELLAHSLPVLQVAPAGLRQLS